MRGWALTAVFLLSMAGLAQAAGSYFEKKGSEFLPGLPYQRALIAFDGEREILILQSVFEFSNVRDQSDFAWILPLPGDARLHEVSEDWLKGVFWEVDLKTAPRQFSLLFDAGPFVCLGLALLVVVVAILKWRSRWGPAILSTLLVPAVLYACLSIFAPENAAPRGVENRDEPIAEGVELLLPDAAAVDTEDGAGRAEVGEPEAPVGEPDDVASESAPKDIVSWLVAEGFACDPRDEAAFREREAKGMSHAVVRVSPTGGPGRLGEASTGFCRTIVVEFRTPEIVFPMVLKSGLSARTELLLYVLGPHCVESSGELAALASVEPTARLAAPGGQFNWERITSPFDGDPILEQPWLTKLKGTLTPEELAEPLVLENAPTDLEYRPRETRWK